MELRTDTGIVWSRVEGRTADNRPFALICDGRREWRLLLDGHDRGTFVSVEFAVDALPTVCRMHPPEHPHGEGR